MKPTTQQTTQTQQKSPSYLSRVKGELINLMVALHPNTTQEAVVKATEDVWTFVRSKITESYWNGVAGGASGRVKPKERAPQVRKGEGA